MSDGSDRLESSSIVAHRYRILRYRGDRGFGQVYEAEDTAMDRKVALMRLRREFSQPDARERFYETRSTAAVEHPSIVDLADYGEDVDGRLFLVMPWVDEAQALDERLRGGWRPEWTETRALLAQIAAALVAAHDKGVLHGGLEPARILIDPSQGVHIVDFGLAPALTEPSGREVSVSTVLPGRVEYLSPEQIRGEPVDVRSDIYALGVLAWELIAGEPPFTGDVVRIADAHVHAPLPRLHASAGHAWVPPQLEPLLRRALAKDPSARLNSVGEFLRVLTAMPTHPPTPMVSRVATERIPTAPAKPSPAAAKPSPAPATASSSPTKIHPPAAKPTLGVVAVATPAPATPSPAPASEPSPANATASAVPPATREHPPASRPPPASPPVSSPAASPPASPPTASPPASPQVTAGVPALPVDHGAAQPSSPPRKRRLGKLELAVIAFLGFDLLLFGAWKLFGSDAESEAAATVASVETPKAAQRRGELAPKPEAEPTEPEPTADPDAHEHLPEDLTGRPPSDPASATGPSLSVEAAIAAELPPEPDTPGPVRPMSKSLSDKAFREAMVEGRDGMLERCLETRMRRTLKVSLKVAPSGKVEYARVLGSLGETALGQCITKQVYKIAFPSTYEGGSHTYTLRLR